MLHDFISKQILAELPFNATHQQAELITELGKFIFSTENEKVFLLKGYAGTGKTSVVSALVRAMNTLQQKTVLLAPTGRAAKVLSSYSGFSAFTIHKKIYRQKSMSEYRFLLADNLSKNTIFIVDEASMISNSGLDTLFGTGRLLDDLITYVYSGENCSLILLGDTAQLPPVLQPQSPALEKTVLEEYGLNIYEYTLTEVVRQALESGILMQATELRRKMLENITFANASVFSKQSFSDVVKIQGSDLIDEIQRSYNEVGVEDTIVVTRSNKQANRYNNGIRSRVMMKEEELTNGDLLMVTRNNYFWTENLPGIDFIANGDVLEVKRIRKYKEMYGFRFVDLTLKSLDYDWEIDARVWLDSLQSENPEQMNKLTNNLFNAVAEDYPEITQKKKLYKKILENEYFNALQVKFAYAVTCHKAQGGQWKKVFIDNGYVKAEQIDIEYYRWLYTAFTRATEKVFLVNFPDEWFEK
ncbi:Exonuclease V subunit alpha [uncultured Paludibacter sp.]|uniref:Exonuclease V subunit alpha n=1 Tax=uncultured Paludibacter sp. TaxID=497635 RepID=A0A653AJV5_9BACT|nr:Exonuclease V subunit alpha [uncultured Paludibacter sp.]